MKETIQVRLDRAAQEELDRLVRQLGWRPSRVVREGIRLLAACHAPKEGIRIIGLGRFCSGIKDPGSDKFHLKDFGK